MFSPISAFRNWLRKPDVPPESQMQRSIEPRLTCNEIVLARRAMTYLEKEGYRYVRAARVDRIGTHCYLVFPSNEDPKNFEEILLYWFIFRFVTFMFIMYLNYFYLKLLSRTIFFHPFSQFSF